MNFWDTSALVALSVDEPHRQHALNALEEDVRMVVWWGASVEYVAALSRRERDGSLTNDEVTRHLAHLRALSRVWYEVQPGQRIKVPHNGFSAYTRCGQPPAGGRARRGRARSYERRFRLLRRTAESGRVTGRISDGDALKH